MVGNCFTQNQLFESKFIDSLKIFYRGESVSNILQVINRDPTTPLKISLNVSHPENWKYLGDKFKIYEIMPNDSVFLPIRLIPIGKIKGNTRYIISCFVYDVVNDITISSEHFFVKKPKLSKWTLTSLPENILYLKNGEEEAVFGYNINNVGTETEDIVLEILPNKIEKIQILDTTGLKLKSLKSTHTIPPLSDTTLYFKAKLTQRLRNYERVDITNADLNNHAERYHIFTTTKQTIFFDTKKRINSSTEIRHLPNTTTVNLYDKNAIPLTMNLVANNITGNSPPIYNLSLRGRKLLNDGSRLFYSSQAFFGVTNLKWNNIFTNISYSMKKLMLNLGNVPIPGGFGGGRGVSASYLFSERLKLSAAVSAGPSIFKPRTFSFGTQASYKPFKGLGLMGVYAHNIADTGRLNSDFIGANVNARLSKSQSLGLGINLINVNSSNPSNPFNSTGFNISSIYNVRFSKFARTRLGGLFNSGTPGALGNLNAQSYNIFHTTSFQLNNNWQLSVNNNYSFRDSINPTFYQYSFINNRIDINGVINNRPFRPRLFYNIFTINNNPVEIKGIQYSFNGFNYSENSRYSLIFSAGNKRKLDSTNAKSGFFLTNFTYKYRVWTGLASLSRGSLSPRGFSSYLINDRQTNFLLSLTNQFQFKNPRYIINSTLSYRSNSRNSISFTPQIYYFTRSDFRLYLNPGFFWSKQKKPIGYPAEAPEIISNYGSFVSFGVKKDFNISMPNSESMYKSTSFRAFIDNNGDHSKNEEESFLENVVIRMGNSEVITNEKGEASIYKVFKDSIYDMAVFSLENLKNYFPYYENKYFPFKDSILEIPFVKGVTIYGEIYIDRDKANTEFNTQIDLSNLRVSALDGVNIYTLTDSKGKFSMYVPFGYYTISIDEDILGNKFKVLENNFKVKLDESTESVFVSFYLVEKRKKITIKKF